MATPQSQPFPSDNFSPEFFKRLGHESATTLVQLVWGILKEGRNRAWEEVEVRGALHRYIENYEERHGLIKPLGMDQPIHLLEIYTAVRLVPPIYLSSFREQSELEQSFLLQGRQHDPFAFSKTRDGVDVANEFPYLNLLGAPGSGKSTFLARLGYEAMLCRNSGEFHPLATRYKFGRLPVLLLLRNFREGNGPPDLIEAIAQEFAVCGFPQSRKFVERMLESGSLLILLDGLDEVPQNRLDDVIAAVSNFAHRYRKWNRFVTSCRTAHYKNFFAQFTDVVMADFSDDQIVQFSQNWFRSPHDREADTARVFLDLIYADSNVAVRELARTPLLLTFLCVTFDEHQELPRARARLYQEALEILLRKWAAKKRVHHEPVYQELHADLELAMLARMAGNFFWENRYFFRREEALEQITSFMAEVLDKPRSLNSGQIFSAIEIQQGLLVQRSADSWSFSHLTIQEYLAARFFWDSQTWREIVDAHLFEPRWREVFLMMAGLGTAIGHTDCLLEAMSARLLRFSRQSAILVVLVGWVRKMIHVQESEGQEALSISLVTLALGLTLSVELDLVPIRHLDAKLKKTKALVKRLRKEVRGLEASNFESLSESSRDRSILDLKSRRDAAQSQATRLLQERNERIAQAPKPAAALSELLARILELSSLLDSRIVRPREIAVDLNIGVGLDDDKPDSDMQEAHQVPTLDMWLGSILIEGHRWGQPIELKSLLEAKQEGSPTFSEQLQAWGFVKASKISDKDIDHIQSFISGFRLILDCRQSSTLISPAAWKRVCLNMFSA